MPNNIDLSQKATIALADLETNGGILSPEQSNQFIRSMMDTPTIMREARVVPMDSPTMKINKIGFGSRILRAANQTQGSRALAEADRSKPDLGSVTLTSKEVIAEIMLPYEVIEDNIERGDIQNTILQLIAERAALDLEELVVQGDTALATATPPDAYLGLLDGVLKKATANVVDAGTAAISATVFNNVVKAMPSKYLRNRSQLRHYVPHDVEQDYRLALSNRGTSLGDDILTGNRPVPVFGSPMVGMALMPTGNMLYTDPKNIVIGFHRNIRIESERVIAERQVRIVLTARVAVEIEEVNAVVKTINLG